MLISYRSADAGDTEAIAQLHAQSWVDTYRGIFSDDYLDSQVWADRKSVWVERFANPPSNRLVMLAVKDQEVVGFVCVLGNEHADHGTFVDNLHVANADRGEGIGKTLMLMAAEWSLENFSDNGMYLEVLEDNQKARRFYERLGAGHRDTTLWQTPGRGPKVRDMLVTWDKIEDLVELCRTES